MMNMKKLTNVKALEMVLEMKEVQSNEELVEKLTAMKTKWKSKNKRRSTSKPTILKFNRTMENSSKYNAASSYKRFLPTEQ